MSLKTVLHWTIILLGAAACEASDSKQPDTILINSPSLAAATTTRAPRLYEILETFRAVRWSGDSSGVGWVNSRGEIACDSTGDITVARNSLGKVRHYLARCRPVATLDAIVPEQIERDDSTKFLIIDAKSKHGDRIESIAATIRISDTSIIRLKGDTIVPLANGSARVDVEVGRCAISRLIRVWSLANNPDSIGFDQIYRRELKLVPGQLESIRLPSGDFRVRVIVDSALLHKLQLAITNSTCAAVIGSMLDYYCTVKDDAWVAVRHTSAGIQRSTVSAILELERRNLLRLRTLAAGVSPSGVPARCVGSDPKRGSTLLSHGAAQ